jgi:CrcB protein
MAVEWTLRAVILVAVGAALGGVLRYFAGVLLTRTDYPWGTLAVNVVGSFLLALFMFVGLQRGVFGPDARLFVATGILGGFTTMSSFSYETMSFLEDAEYLRATGYAALTFVGSIGAAIAGRLAAGLMPGGG